MKRLGTQELEGAAARDISAALNAVPADVFALSAKTR